MGKAYVPGYMDGEAVRGIGVAGEVWNIFLE
jgi:hypothetical protein